jgi:ABC transport system ATP-binding/permease protein
MSTLLQVDNLARSYGEKNLFENISFTVGQYQKVALIAKNGAGKTSLLNIIAGLEPCDAGSSTIFNPFTFEYLMQEPSMVPENTVFEEVYSHTNEFQRAILEYERVIRQHDPDAVQRAIERMDAIQGWEYDTRVKQILTQLKLPDLDQKVGTLSGGQRKRVALAKVLITEPDLLILDEPTNHLDVEMIEWLEEYLTKSTVTLFMVTHDRYFLDRVCDEILEMENAAIYRYRGNYGYFVEKQAERIDNMNKETERARNLLRTEQEWMRRMPKARTTKAKARIDSFYELKDKAENKIREDRLNLSIEGARMGNKILEINDVSFKWGDEPILSHFTYTFKRFEKIGIVGRNGSGKSTFLDIVTGKIRPQMGSLQKGETIQFGYYRQQGLVFNEQTTVLDVVKSVAEVVRLGNGDTISASAFLNHFLFPYPSHHQPVYKLSGGEKRRLYLVTVLMQSPNFLILDEPTNDLDLLTLNVMEEYLASYNGCVIVVTHDRYFLDKIVEHLFVFEGEGVIRDFPGNYTQYKLWDEKRRRSAVQQKRAETPKPVKSREPAQGVAKLSFKEKRELEMLEKEIAELEQEKLIIVDALHSGLLNTEALTEQSLRYSHVVEEVERKTERWMELTEKEDLTNS